MNKPLRVLVVDDSAFMRKAIRSMLEKDPRINEVCVARSAEEAEELIAEKPPDVITVDLYMPEKSGAMFIKEQMRRKPFPFVVCSSAEKDNQAAMEAMEAGAVEFVRKPTAMALEKMYNIQQEIIEAVLTAASIEVDKLPAFALQPGIVPEQPSPPQTTYAARRQIHAVLIGISTGGPGALRAIMPRIPANLPVPIAIALHLPAGYTQAYAEKLNELCQIEVIESGEGVFMEPGRAILAQGGLHTILVRQLDGRVKAQLTDGPVKSLYKPCVDELFRTGAEAYHGRVLGIVLTGMGNDGTAGAGWIKASGGKVFAEAESTSVIFGMPRSVIEAGLADRVLPIDMVPDAILEELT